MTARAHELQVSNLGKTFPTPAGDITILSGLQLEMKSGDAVAITGPSGSGKSTLLYIIGLLDRPTSGTVLLDAEEPLALSVAAQAAFRSRHIGFVFQDHHLLPQCTVIENVLLPALAADGITPETERRARELLERVGLKARLDHVPAQLSGGERQRVAVCRALINSPRLLLADEPTGNLDRHSAEIVGTLLLEIAQEQQTMLLCVTHSLELAKRLPRHFELIDGKLVPHVQAASSPV